MLSYDQFTDRIWEEDGGNVPGWAYEYIYDHYLSFIGNLGNSDNEENLLKVYFENMYDLDFILGWI